jgi:hypothetical protein
VNSSNIEAGEGALGSLTCGPRSAAEATRAALVAARRAVIADPDSTYRAFYEATYHSGADDEVIADAVDCARREAGLEPIDGLGGVFAVRRARADRARGYTSAYDPEELAEAAVSNARAVSVLVAHEVFGDLSADATRDDFVAALCAELAALPAADAERAVENELRYRSKGGLAGDVLELN